MGGGGEEVEDAQELLTKIDAPEAHPTNFRALLPLGTDEAMLADLLDDPGLTPVTALLLADGGAAELNPPEWVEKLRPQVVMLSAGAGDQPDPEVVAALDGYTVLRTDRNGWIELTTDGEQMWVEVEKSPAR